MIRYINISNDKNRDAEITFKSLNPKPAIKMALESGEKIILDTRTLEYVGKAK